MPVYLLSIYIALIFIRPMDWWEPIMGWQLVTLAAIFTLLAGFPKIMDDFPQAWKAIPSVKHGFFFVFGCMLSWVPVFWFEGMWASFQEMFKIYILFVLVIVFGRTDKGYQLLTRTLLLCSLWMAIHAILQIHRGYGFADLRPRWRVRNPVTKEGDWQAIAFGIFEDPNDLCLIFIMAVPLFYAELRSKDSPLFRMLAMVGIPVVSYGVFCTNSRGGYLGIFAMVIAFLMSRTKGFKRWFLLGFSIFFLTTFAPSRFAAGIVGQSDRAILWGQGIAAWKTHPIFGVGFGDFGSYSNERKAAHNTYVHVLTETGVVGYLPFFLLVYFCFVILKRAMALGFQLRLGDKLFMAGLYSAAVGYFTSLYFLSRQKTHVPYIILGLMIAKAINVCQNQEMFDKVTHFKPQDYWRAIIFGFGSVIFMWVTIRIVNAIG
ncbi:MAG: hypothetical protein PCFJNLEI_01863 [Verrucomicrobiae bacterium]|nr:hypothetical protein [Verrucomicrobiae bacterium]